MKEFRFAWNGKLLSKQQTRLILFTIIAILIPLIVTITTLFLLYSINISP